MQKRRLTAVAALAAGGLTASVSAATTATAVPHGNATTYQVGLFGDQPYGPNARAAYPGVLADINAHDLAFSVFDGDIKNGSERCDTWQYDNAETWFNSLSAPVVYTPGDNEWTDCDRASNGSYDPNERLAYIRERFFDRPHSLGQSTMVVTRQMPSYPENARWVQGTVTWVTVNIPGSDNNATQYDANGVQVDGDQQEYAARSAADQQWLTDSFQRAVESRSKAVVIVIQADMWSTGDPTAHFADTKATLARLARGFVGQVYLVNGDSHNWTLDHPLTDAYGTVPNVTRVTTDGSKNYGWTLATIDTSSGTITFERHKIN